ncbi:MAG: TlyA family RNA methyltransferase [Anaerolineae bacterium]|nr:TlyA family RNA methyltransferase [Anaerolineae bacterium]
MSDKLQKIRLDLALHQRGLAPSREKARAMIMAGEVLVDGRSIDKPGMPVNTNAVLEVKAKPRFVSRGGDKLAGALTDFQFDVTGLICADVGASTGGFTDCLLQSGAAKVYAIDVGYGQLDYMLRQDERVVVMDRTNARYVAALPEAVQLVVVDASFISLKLLLPVFKVWVTPQADIIALIKPQFEAGRKDVGKGGVVRDHAVHSRVLTEILTFAAHDQFAVRDLTPSPLTGPAGNIEFLVWLSYGYAKALPAIDELVQQAMSPWLTS